MALVAMKKLLAQAEKLGYAVGAFSVGNMEMALGAVRAAEEMQTPIILQIAEVRLPNSPLYLMGPMMLAAARESTVDIAVHLDHGLTEETVQAALEMGFTSVMFDGSQLPLAQNIEQVQRIVKLAKRYGATVEAELGVIGGNEGEGKAHAVLCTDPGDAVEFCHQTGVDALAVAIGNAHGNYPRLPELRFDVLEAIHRAVKVPLVLHGGTGITPEMFRRCIALGVRKINIATASFDALANCARDYCAGVRDRPNYFALSASAVEGVYQNVRKHIEIFNM